MEYVNREIEKLLETDVDALKYRAIQDYMNLIDNLELGKTIDYQNILELISLIDIYSVLPERKAFYKEFYLNGRFI